MSALHNRNTAKYAKNVALRKPYPLSKMRTLPERRIRRRRRRRRRMREAEIAENFKLRRRRVLLYEENDENKS